MAVKSSDQITVIDLTDGYSIMLSLDAISLNGGIDKLGTAQSVTVNVTAYKGGSMVVPTIGTPVCPTNVTASVGAAADSVVPVTINFAAALNEAGKVTIPVTIDEITINKEFAFGIAFKGATGETGAKGDTGTAAYSYDLIVSHAAIQKNIEGAYNPAAITLTAKRLQGTGSPSNYSGRFKVEKTADGSTWSNVYTSSGNEATKSVTVPADIKALRCSLYLAGGTSILIDQQTVPIVSDGATGATGDTGAKGDTGEVGATGEAGADAYTIVLTNEAHSFAAGVSAAIAGSATSKVVAYKGGSQISCYAGASASATSISTGTTGLTCAITNNNSQDVTLTFSATTSLKTKSGTVSIPVVADGKSFTKIFTWTLSLTGATGKTGEKGDTGATGETGAAGEDAILLAITTSAGNIFKNSSGNTTLTAHVYKAGAEVTGSALTALGTIKWYKDGTYMTGKDGTTLLVNATDVANKATYEARLEA